MSLDKAIQHNKEHRRPYFGAGRWDLTCRPNGGCAWCRRNRAHANNKRKAAARAQLKEFDVPSKNN